MRWREIADLGWPGIAVIEERHRDVIEEHGGQRPHPPLRHCER